jgi:hypothetical protein
MSKLTDCFLIENGVSVPVYDANPTGPTFIATRYGVSRAKETSLVRVPLFPFTDVEVEDRCAILLLEAAKYGGWANVSPYDLTTEIMFTNRGLVMYRVLSSADHHLIPPNRRIAVAEPEYVGRIVVSGNHRGVALLNPLGVIGCKKMPRTAFEVVLAD